MMQKLFGFMLCGVSVLLAPGAVGQVFPVKPVRLIVSFPPGAGPDIVARTVGQKLTERWGSK